MVLESEAPLYSSRAIAFCGFSRATSTWNYFSTLVLCKRVVLPTAAHATGGPREKHLPRCF